MKRIVFVLILVSLLALLLLRPSSEQKSSELALWQLRAVDTMKYSRDPSREKLHDPVFDQEIATQVQSIAKMGATHIAIATPYDEEFVPILQRWVTASRKNNLHVWFRGNWSGWEGWFGYPKIDRSEHLKKTEEFILNHPDLFADGDIFMGCPECENGGPGDPRRTGAVEDYRKFLIDEHIATKNAFAKIGKKVSVDYNSMNGDVARLIMDKPTTKALGGYVVIDHYVATPGQLAKDVKQIADESGGNVVLGEFGAPIPDLTGALTEDEQAEWVREALEELASVKELSGVNYWVNKGGSTALFNSDGTPRKVVSVLTSFYKPLLREVKVVDPLGGAVNNIVVTTLRRDYKGTGGHVTIPLTESEQPVNIGASGYGQKRVLLNKDSSSYTVVLDPTSENLIYKLRKLLRFVVRV